MEAPIVITAEDVLLVIDVQNDFLPGGALAVADGDAIIPLVDRLGRAFENVVVTQDWHPTGHASFASSHPEAEPFDLMELPYGNQVLWPDHCVQGSPARWCILRSRLRIARLRSCARARMRWSIPIRRSPRPTA
jgi:nicotinamidase/pyrazinamidase